MKLIHLILATCILLLISSCSNGANPVMPEGVQDSQNKDNSETFAPKDASDVLYSSANPEQAYKAYGVYHVVIDPVSLTGEITPARNASAIGDVFDADLTQFLTVTPCPNCLMINGIQVINSTQVQVGFAVKHPFGDISKRPDLHGFDVRGIVLAEGNYDFPQTNVLLDASTPVPARANVTLVENPDGYTHHFDELAADTHYFNPPRDYDANINPYKRYFENSTTGAFDPHAPVGFNVMPTGASWDTQNYIFNTSASPLDFGFIVDCSYGVSAKFSNRNNPYYFLPEFNRKEAWKVESSIVSNNLQTGNMSSTALIRVSACDWQAGLVPDPNYPDTSNLGGIRAKSDVFCASVEIAGVSTLVTHTGPTGSGTAADPYIFNIPQANTSGAPSGWYYGIVAVRDDLHGTTGPIGIPESPTGFPYAGPDIVDYQTYSIFRIRVAGSPPVIGAYIMPGDIFEGEFIFNNHTVTEPDGDTVTYLWEQVSTNTADGHFIDPTVLNSVWQAPPLFDISPDGEQFTLRLTASDVDGSDQEDIIFNVHEFNQAPECQGLDSNPFYGVIRPPDVITITADMPDYDGDDVFKEWDMDWDGDPDHFVVDSQADYIYNYSWLDQGFYDVCCRGTEQNRTNPLQTFCSRMFIQEGLSNDIVNIDEDPDATPSYSGIDIAVQSSSPSPSVTHVVWTDMDDGSVFYANNVDDKNDFGNNEEIFAGLTDHYGMVPQIVVSEEYVYVFWIQVDTIAGDDNYYAKVRISNDSGETFGPENTVATFSYPRHINGLDASVGTLGNDVVALVSGYSDVGPAQYVVQPYASTNHGQNWTELDSVRDVISTYLVYNPQIKVSSENNLIHVCWLDRLNSDWSFYYDWSDDGGASWNTDTLVTGSDAVATCAMQVTYPGDAYFTWFAGGAVKLSKIAFALPLTVERINELTIFGGTVAGIDMWTSLYADTLDIVFINEIASDFTFYHFYSFDQGQTFQYISRPMNATDAALPRCAGIRLENPERSMITTAWIRNFNPIIPAGHIDSDYLYLAERF